MEILRTHRLGRSKASLDCLDFATSDCSVSSNNTWPTLGKSSVMKMASTSTETKRFTARYHTGPIFILGGASKAHEVLSELGNFRRMQLGPHSDNPCLSGVRRLGTQHPMPALHALCEAAYLAQRV